MAFPNLARKTDPRNPDGVSEIWAEATGIPDPGPNVIGLPYIAAGVAPNEITDEWLDILVEALGPGVTGVTWGSLAPDKLSMVLNFAADGISPAMVRCRIYHTVIS